MTHTYFISGMTCTGCSDKVKKLLEAVPGVTAAAVGHESGKAEVTMTHHVDTADLQSALAAYPQYRLTEAKDRWPQPPREAAPSFWVTYKPVLLVFAYIAGATLLGEIASGAERREWIATVQSFLPTVDFYYGLDWMRWMRHFMAGFFLVFSFFKLLDVSGFAAAYQGYDEVAKRWPGWGRLYPFVELGLGVSLLLNLYPLFTNVLTFLVMGVGTVGVVRALRSKRPFQCACLGAVFNLPMSRITLFEDVLMVVMSAAMIVHYL